MSTAEVIRYADGFYRRTIYGLGPYIADYPEQAFLCCIVQGWCPKCTANKKDLDGSHGRRTRQLTDWLMGTLDENVLWKQYGIVDGIKVLLVCFHPKVSTEGISVAIYRRLSPC